MQPTILYHCTTDNRGPTLVVDRRYPAWAKNEPATPRLCVAPSVAACFAARLFTGAEPTVYVYRTRRPTRGIKPREVNDSSLTGERWLIQPAELIYERTIDAATVRQVQHRLINWIHEIEKCPPLKIKIAHYARAYRILGGPEWEGRLMDVFVKNFLAKEPAR